MEKILNEILEKLGSLEQGQRETNTHITAVEQQLIAFQQFTLECFNKQDKKMDRIEQKADKALLLIENEITPSLKALAEGHAMQQGQLDRIEKQVCNHDEMIFRLVK